MTKKSPTLHTQLPEGYVESNPSDAKRMGIADSEMVKVGSRCVEIRIRAKVTDIVPEAIIFIPFHFAESAANVLTNPALDPKAKIPEFKVCAARAEKIV